jgi:hypothetical protein
MRYVRFVCSTRWNAAVDRYDTPTNTSWYGMTINYQMDGNSLQQDYSVYLDKLNF